MALTRIQAETIVVKRLGPLMSAAGMAITYVGTNADLSDPLAWATRQLGHTTADVSTVTTAELASVSDYDKFLGLAEYRALQNVLGALDDVDLKVGPRSEKFSQLTAQAQKKLDRLHKAYGRTQPVVGIVTLNFAEHD